MQLKVYAMGEDNSSNWINDCIRCLLCFQVCPVIQNTYGLAFPSPNIFSADFPRRETEPMVLSDVAYNCLLCGLCQLVCPRNIDTPACMHYLRNMISKNLIKN